MKTKGITGKTHPGNIFITVIAIMVIIGGAIYFFKYLLYANAYTETNDAQVEANINPVSARTGGYIQKVWFNEYHLVKKGDTLVTLDNRETTARLMEAQAAVEDAKAQLLVLAAGIGASETATRVNYDQIKGAKAKFLQQQQDIKRYQNLVKEEAATGSDLEQVKARHDVAESEYDAAKNSLQTSLAKIKELNTHTALLEADLKRKEAGLAIARLNLSYTVICAPYAGRMGKKNILEGQQIQSGQPLVNIVNEKEKWITANFMETQVNGMFIGQPVLITIDAMNGRKYKGKITAIAGSTGAKSSLLPPDNSTGNFVKIIQRIPVKISFEGGDTHEVIAGMNVIVAVEKNKS